MAEQPASRSERESQQAHDEAARSFPIARPVREWFGKILDAENRQIVSSVSPEYAVQIVHLLNHGAIRSEQRQSSPVPECGTPEVPEGCTPADAALLRESNHKFAQENNRLREALRFYANQDHWIVEGKARIEWDTVSGEPQNWHWRENEHDEAEGVEDGSIARMALLGQDIDWEGDAPKYIDGEPEFEVTKAASEAPVSGCGERPCETCNGDPAECAKVPGLRHCEAATRSGCGTTNAAGQEKNDRSSSSGPATPAPAAPTPRTDALVGNRAFVGLIADVVALARQLERELAAARSTSGALPCCYGGPMRQGCEESNCTYYRENNRG